MTTHMHIAMIGQKGMPAIHGGVERHVHDLSIRLVQAGHIVDAYSRSWYTGTKEDSILSGVNIVHASSINTKHLDTISYTLVATIKAMRSDADVLHYHGVGPSLLSFIPRIFAPSKRVVNTFHSIDRKHAKWGFIAKLSLTLGEWASCAFAHKTIAVSRTIQQYSRDVYNADVTYIPNGVELLSESTTTDALDTFGLTSGEYIVALSRLISHKGMHYLVDAYIALEQSNKAALKGKKLVIIGDGYYTDTYVAALKKQASVSKNIIFTGFQSGTALQELMSHAHLYVHPSDNEGLPITVLEAMSYGLPSLLSDIPEHYELISTSDYLFEAGNVSSLMEGLVRMLDSSILRAAASASNRKTIEDTFSWEHVVLSIIDVYDEVLDTTLDSPVLRTPQLLS